VRTGDVQLGWLDFSVHLLFSAGERDKSIAEVVEKSSGEVE
jgi:hypothetical protein